jgi:hypothetical protein
MFPSKRITVRVTCTSTNGTARVYFGWYQETTGQSMYITVPDLHRNIMNQYNI